jgi:hypothetical protein
MTLQCIQEVFNGISEAPHLFETEEKAFKFYYQCAKENEIDLSIDGKYRKADIGTLVNEVRNNENGDYDLLWWELETE